MARRRRDGRSAFKVAKRLTAAWSVWKANVSDALGLSGEPGAAVMKRKKGALSVNAGDEVSPLAVSANRAGLQAAQFASANFQRAASWFQTLRPASPEPSNEPQGFTADDWRRHYERGEQGAPREFSFLTKNIGGRILQLGSNVPADIRAKAMIAANGTTSRNLNEGEMLNEFRSYLGIEESGATKLRRATGMMRGMVQGGFRMAQLAQMSMQGGAIGMAANAQLGLDAIDKGEQIVHSKFVETLLSNFTDKIVKDPALGVKMSHFMGRVFRIGGAVGTAAAVVHGAVTGRVDSQFNANLADQGLASARRDFGTGEMGQRLENLATKNYQSQKGMYGRVMDWLGYTAGTQEGIAQAARKELGQRSALRSRPSLTGLNVAGVLAQRATDLGVSVEDLTPDQRNDAIDKANEQALQALQANPDVIRTSEIRGSHVYVNGKKIPWIGMEAYKAQTETLLREGANDFLNGTGDHTNNANSPAVRQKNQKRDYELYLQRMDPQEKISRRIELERRDMNQLAERQRRQVTRFD